MRRVIHATTEISRSFFVPFATVVLSSIARDKFWCFNGALSARSCTKFRDEEMGVRIRESCSFGVEKATPKTSAFKEEMLSNGRSKRKGRGMTKDVR